MTPDDRAEVERKMDGRMGCLVLALWIVFFIFGFAINLHQSRISALEAQVKELKEGKR